MQPVESFNICTGSNSFNMVIGGGYFKIDGEAKDESFINDPVAGIIPIGSDPTSLDSKALNLYAYTYLNFLKNVTFTLGASYDKNQNEGSDTLIKTSSTRNSGLHGIRFRTPPFVRLPSGH